MKAGSGWWSTALAETAWERAFLPPFPGLYHSGTCEWVYPTLLPVKWVLYDDQTEVTSGQTKPAKNLGCTRVNPLIFTRA